MPPEAMAAMRCSTSMGMPAAWALSMKVCAMAARAMLMPPEAEPVMPASEVTATASPTSGSGIALSALATIRKPGSAAITPPKPYSAAVFIDASSAPETALLLPSAKCALMCENENSRMVAMPAISAPITAHSATWSCALTGRGCGRPGSSTCEPAGYQPGIQRVSRKLATPTTTSGSSATSG